MIITQTISKHQEKTQYVCQTVHDDSDNERQHRRTFSSAFVHSAKVTCRHNGNSCQQSDAKAGDRSHGTARNSGRLMLAFPIQRGSSRTLRLQPEHAPGDLHCMDGSARARTAIKPAINSNEIVAAIAFAVGLSFHDRRPWLVALISSPLRSAGGLVLCAGADRSYRTAASDSKWLTAAPSGHGFARTFKYRRRSRRTYSRNRRMAQEFKLFHRFRSSNHIDWQATLNNNRHSGARVTRGARHERARNP